jgi:exodeoxyribonuclease VII large subunit
MVNIIRRRFPPASIVLYPVSVQGTGAAAEIAHAIRQINAHEMADVVIVGRGGGSLEDLWAFNEESVARAIFASTIPVVSAVGHEIDFTIADFVADLRAPTPSAAAELVVPSKSVILDNLAKHRYTISQIVQAMLEERKATIQKILRSHSFNKPLDRVRQSAQKMDDLERVLGSLTGHRLAMLKANIESMKNRVLSLSPSATLKRGYALVYCGNKVIARASELKPGNVLRTEFQDGGIESIVSGIRE